MVADQPVKPAQAVFSPGDQPFVVEESDLAFALYLAFQRFVDEQGWVFNYYTSDMLRELGYRGKAPLEAVKQAVKDRKRGVVSYLFKQPTARLLHAFVDQKVELEKADGLARDTVNNLLQDFKVDARAQDEVTVRLVCVIINTFKQFIQEWEKTEGMLRIDDGTLESRERQSDGSTVAVHKGFKFIGMNANQKTRERLEL